MSEERLQKIKGSVEFQKEMLKAHNMTALSLDEEEELIEEIERLNNIINELEKAIIEFKKQIEEERKNYLEIIGNFVDKVRELKGSDKE